MKFTRSNRIFAAFMAVLFLCASVPAQYSLGTRRMVSRPTPVLVNRSRLPTVLGPRPRMGFVGRVGGIASDGVAVPEQGLLVNTMLPTYSMSRPDGQRLSVIINGQAVTAPIYDWQLIPIAKFANSDSFSCYTLFGRANDGPRNTQQIPAERHQEDSRYHLAFKDTLVGLRLFQLDSLIFDPDNVDLVKDGNKYILGNGESAPNLKENGKGFEALENYQETNPELWHFTSYVISDYRRKITFGVNQNSLRIKGEPYVYFWRIDPEAEDEFVWGGQAEEAAKRSLGSISRYTTAALIKGVIDEASKYDQLTDGTGFLNAYLDPDFEDVLVANPAQRAGLLRTRSRTALYDFLLELRTVNSLNWTIEMRELSDKVSSNTAMLRAINPAVWDTGVNLIRYAAFFRYCKANAPQQWQAFMAQINAAPPPKPPVTTPSGFEQ